MENYRHTGDLPGLPDGVAASVRQTGVALCYPRAADTYFDLLVADATRNAWGPVLNNKLLWFYWTGQATLVTQEAFKLDHRAMLIGVSEDYALILPAVGSLARDRAPRPRTWLSYATRSIASWRLRQAGACGPKPSGCG